MLYDKSQIDFNDLLFSNKELKLLLIPLVIEQLLNCLMGMVDTMMVSTVSATAISAVSLVDSMNNLVIQVFSALATGAAVICSQYLGRRDQKGSNRAARQVVLSVAVISLLITVICIVTRRPLLRLVFGSVDADIMEAALVYFFITVLSYPFLALFNAGSAFYRAEGNAKFPMRVSVTANIMNIFGNAILIFVFEMGVAGAAISTLASRVFSVIVIYYFLRKPKQAIVINQYAKIRPDFSMIAMILGVGIPAGIENGMFQFGKLAIQSTVSTMGKTAIAAQAMTNIMEMMNCIAAMGIGIGLMTVAGQCVGAGRREEARYNIVKLTALSELTLIPNCLLVLLMTKPVTHLAGMEPESAALCFEMVIAITIFKPLFWTLSFIPAYGMRAAGDVKFSMIVSTLSMWLCRVVLCVYLARVWHMGPMAVWIGMFADWGIRGLIFSFRFLSGKWLQHNMI